MSGSPRAFLLEVGCEEVPDRMLEEARRGLGRRLGEALAAERMPAGDLATFATPRRLAVRVEGLPEWQSDETVEVAGPPAHTAFDRDGKPTRAALGFAAGQGVGVEDLYRVAGPKGEVVAARRTTRGLPTPDLLARVVPAAVLGLPFPKTMSWGAGVQFVRPIRWVVALLGRDVVPLTLAGVPAGRRSPPRRGSGRPPVEITEASSYEAELRQAGVLVLPQERRERIVAAIEAAARGAGGGIVADEELVGIVCNLVEEPGAFAGAFPAGFLDLPAEVLTTTLRHHQRSFSVVGAGEALLPHFVSVVNAPRDPEGTIRRGYERVVAGRLADARFFFSEDRRRPLADRHSVLARTRFHQALGSYEEKVRRLEGLVGRLGEMAGAGAEVRERARRAAYLSKCDLATQMENEFPELQGVIGGLYARAEGEPGEVWRAVYDQYAPSGLEDRLPRELEGALLSLSDRLDTLVGLMGVGVTAKGSSDPFALRRAATGLLRILVERPVHLPLRAVLAAAAEGYRGQEVAWKHEGESLMTIVRDFLEGRLRFLLEKSGAGHRYDSINAVLAAGWDDPADAAARLSALSALRGEDDFEAICVASKRIRNILAQAGFENGGMPDARLMSEPAERDLHEAAGTAADRVRRATERRDHAAALRAIAALRPQVDRFFDKVLVMAEDGAVRRNRLALLASIARLCAQEADFAEVVVEGAS